jgi:hypothetical protein
MVFIVYAFSCWSLEMLEIVRAERLVPASGVYRGVV